MSDWSSDVCSSDLLSRPVRPGPRYGGQNSCRRLMHGCTDGRGRLQRCGNDGLAAGALETVAFDSLDLFGNDLLARRHGLCGHRSAERRVGKEWCSTCKSWWWPSAYNKTEIN